MSDQPDITQLIGLQANKPVLDKAGFAAIVATCTGLQTTSVVWKNDPQGFVSDTDRARIVLDLFSIKSDVGWDERRRVYNLPGYPPNAFVTVLLGNRTVIITMRAEVFDANAEAAELIDAVRSNLFSDFSNDQLSAINLAWVDSESAVRTSYQIDERVVNCAIADFTFGGIAQHVSGISIDGNPPVLPGSGPTWIEYVNDTNNDIPGTLTP